MTLNQNLINNQPQQPKKKETFDPNSWNEYPSASLVKKYKHLQFYSHTDYKISWAFVLGAFLTIYLPIFLAIVIGDILKFAAFDLYRQEFTKNAFVLFYFAWKVATPLAFLIIGSTIYKKRFFQSGLGFAFAYIFLRIFIALILPSKINGFAFLELVDIILATITFSLAMVFCPDIRRSFVLIFKNIAFPTKDIRAEILENSQPNLKSKSTTKNQWNMTKFGYFILVLVICAVGTIFLNSLGSRISHFILNTGPQNQKAIDNSLVQPNAFNVFLLVLNIILIAPFIEELQFRLALGTSKKMGPWTIILSAFVFGTIHLGIYGDSVFSIFSYLFAGAGLGFAYWMFGNIWLNIGIHATMNVISLIYFAVQQ